MAAEDLWRRPGEPVWVRLKEGGAEAFIDAKVVGAEGDKVTVETSEGSKETHTADELLRVNPDKQLPDLTNLLVLNEATLLDNLRQRFVQGKIYTRAASLLMCAALCR